MIKEKTLKWFCPIPTHYQNYLFQKIHEECQFNLEIIYFKNTHNLYPWKNNFGYQKNSKQLKKSFFSIDFKNIFLPKRNDLYYIIAGWSEPTMFLMLTYFAIRKHNYLIYTDTPKDRPIKGIRQILRKIWLNYIFSRAKGILVTGNWGVEIIKKFQIKQTSVVNFPFVTDNEMFSPQKKNNEKLTFFSSGRLVINHKGYDTSFKALKLFKEINSCLDFEYKIAGSGSDKKKLEDLAKELDLEKNITFLGWQEVHNLPSLYNSCDIFLHSSYFDPFPNAVLEAMSCGCIVVASDLAGSAIERIEHGTNGFIHKAGDPENLSIILNNLVNLSTENITQISTQARNTSTKLNYKYNIEILNKIIS